MKHLLQQLQETIEMGPNVIQFRIDDMFYELDKNKKGEWVLFTLFGDELNLDLVPMKNLTRQQMEAKLISLYPNAVIY